MSSIVNRLICKEDKVVFENVRFLVVTRYETSPVEVAGAKFWQVYVVINKDTEVIEVKTPGLVEAIMYAENCDRALEARPWERVRKTEAEFEAAVALAEASRLPDRAN